MEEGIVAIPEGPAVSLHRFGWHRRIAEPFMAFDVRRPLSRHIALGCLVSVVGTLLGGLAKFYWRWWWRRRRWRLIINRLRMSAPNQSEQQQ
jgi:hypothetical protein